MAKQGPKGPSKWTEDRVAELGAQLDQWRMSPTNFLLVKFCDENDIYPALLSRLADKHDNFYQALKRAKAHQEAVVAEAMLAGEMPAAGAIFALKNLAGWRDEHKHEVQGNITIELVKFTSKDIEPDETQNPSQIPPA